MISLEKLSGQKINRPEFSQLLKEKLMTVL
jgi:hypothetical protein